ncbi:hypothetical protein C0J52_08902 [Blattella germanica]|nr:hypothetical protein C0J52_08902 [Blattella germanica]
MSCFISGFVTSQGRMDKLERDSATHLGIVTKFSLLIRLSNCCVHVKTGHRDNPVEIISYTPPQTSKVIPLPAAPCSQLLSSCKFNLGNLIRDSTFPYFHSSTDPLSSASQHRHVNGKRDEHSACWDRFVGKTRNR